MSQTDPIADMLTCIRNANMVQKEKVDIPLSKVKEGIARVLKREGFINDFRIFDDKKRGILRVYLKYGPSGEKIIHAIERVSRPSRRVYRGWGKVGHVLAGLGSSILSTPEGILSDRECRERKVGGEVLCRIW